LQFTGPGSAVFELLAHERRLLDRQVLAVVPPDPTWQISEEVRRVIRQWLARRYQRQALPDEFNRRLAPSGSRLRELLKKGSRPISGLYGTIVSEELPEEKPYEFDLVGTMRVDDFRITDLRTTAHRCLVDIVKEINSCRGLVVREFDVVSEADFSLDDVAHSKRMDSFDDLTLREDGQPTAS
jgi:hypothetical protein